MDPAGGVPAAGTAAAPPESEESRVATLVQRWYRTRRTRRHFLAVIRALRKTHQPMSIKSHLARGRANFKWASKKLAAYSSITGKGAGLKMAMAKSAAKYSKSTKWKRLRAAQQVGGLALKKRRELESLRENSLQEMAARNVVTEFEDGNNVDIEKLPLWMQVCCPAASRPLGSNSSSSGSGAGGSCPCDSLRPACRLRSIARRAARRTPPTRAGARTVS